MKFDQIAISQADRRIKPLRESLENTRVRPGWIHYMRTILGMTLKDLAIRAGVSTPTVAQSERREAEGKVTLETLRKIAKSMECEFVYAFIPKSDIKTLLKSKALKKAEEILARADTHMALENQKVTGDKKMRIERLAKNLYEKGDVW